MQSKHARIYTDGGARGNPGPAALGVVAEVDGKEHLYKKYLGKRTNNQAEYEALIFALHKAIKLDVKTVEVYMDSELIVNQLNQKYKVKDKELAKLFVQAWNASLQFTKITFTHIARSKNKKADTLVNEAIDEAVK